MLLLKPTCENCGKLLPNESTVAMICSFECTFCKTCVDTILENVCPNCGGGFEKRPNRPVGKLSKYPPSETIVFKIFNPDSFASLKKKYQSIPPQERI